MCNRPVLLFTVIVHCLRLLSRSENQDDCQLHANLLGYWFLLWRDQEVETPGGVPSSRARSEVDDVQQTHAFSGILGDCRYRHAAIFLVEQRRNMYSIRMLNNGNRTGYETKAP